MVSKATSSDQIQFSSGLTVFSPLNSTYNSRFVTLNMTFDIGAGLECSLNYSIDGNDLGAIPLVSVDTGYMLKGQKSGLLQLPELSEGTHYLTIDVLCGLYDYHGNPPGAPFTPTFLGSSDYTATWTHTIQFTIDTSTTDPEANWVEVTRFAGSGSQFGMSSAFTCDHVDWRVRWQNNPFLDFGDQSIQFYVVPTENVTDHFDGSMGIESVKSYAQENGTLYLDNSPGTFHFWIAPSSSNWELIVEQNVNTIPEFPANVIVWVILILSSMIILFKNLGNNQNEKTN